MADELTTHQEDKSGASTKGRYNVSTSRNDSFRMETTARKSIVRFKVQYIKNAQNHSYVNTELLRRKNGDEISILLLV
jgi:hypothetical protein